MKKIVFFTLLATFFSAQIVAQVSQPDADRKEKKPFKDRLFWGGDIGAAFGTSTFVNIAPLGGYRITDKLSVGLGGTYQYYSIRFSDGKYSSSIYGGQVFSRYNFTDRFFAHTEYQILNMEVFDPIGWQNRRTNIPFLYVGGGVAYPMGRNSAIVGMLLYDTLQHRLSPFSSPLQYRGGIVIGI